MLLQQLTQYIPRLDWHFLPGPTTKHKGTYIKGTIGTCFNIAARLSGRLVGLEPSAWRTIGRNEAHVVLDLGGLLASAYVNILDLPEKSLNFGDTIQRIQMKSSGVCNLWLPIHKPARFKGLSLACTNKYRKEMRLQAIMHWPGLTRLQEGSKDHDW